MGVNPRRSGQRSRKSWFTVALPLAIAILTWTWFFSDHLRRPGLVPSAIVTGICLAWALSSFSRSQPAPVKAAARAATPRAALLDAHLKSPRDPALLIQLAREEKKRGNLRAGEKYYRKAIHELWAIGERALAAAVYEEFFLNYGKVFCGPIQFHLARELCRQGKFEMAALSLEAFIRAVEVKPELIKEPELMPQAFAALGRIFDKRLHKPDEARRVFAELLAKYPRDGWQEALAG